VAAGLGGVGRSEAKSSPILAILPRYCKKTSVQAADIDIYSTVVIFDSI
jgi:hypothetical protein